MKLLQYLIIIMDKISNIFDKCIQYIVVLLLAALVLIVNASVFYRYVLSNPVKWTEEISIYIIIYVVFLGSGMALKRGKHVGIRIILEKFPYSIKKIIEIVISFGIIFFLLVLIRESYLLSIFSKMQRSPAVNISYYWRYIIVSIGGINMVIQTVNILFKDLFTLIKIIKY
mgnify:CR=1 FL=1